VRCEGLEEIPFLLGYGGETSHILDVYPRWGTEAFGQTDLDPRAHRNQETLSLGKMAFGILRTFFARSQANGLKVDMKQVACVMRQFQVRLTLRRQSSIPPERAGAFYTRARRQMF